MLRIPISALSRQKNAQLALSATTPPMYIIIEKYSYDKDLKTHTYDIEIGTQDQHDVIIRKIKTRYSVLRKLHQSLKSSFRDTPIQPKFPPQKYIFNNNPEFIKERASDLQKYLAQLTKIPGVTHNSNFVSLFHMSDDSLSD